MCLSPFVARVGGSGKECGEECDNNRIYVSGLPTTITESDLVEKFSTIGILARIRQVGFGFALLCEAFSRELGICLCDSLLLHLVPLPRCASGDLSFLHFPLRHPLTSAHSTHSVRLCV